LFRILHPPRSKAKEKDYTKTVKDVKGGPVMCTHILHFFKRE